MSAADFLFSPEVQQLLQVIYAHPDTPFEPQELARKTRLDLQDVERTLAHLIQSGVLTQTRRTAGKETEDASDGTPPVQADSSFIFYGEFRSIALKSFAVAEPLRKMLRSRFGRCVLHAFVLGEDRSAGSVEVLIVYGDTMPEEADMQAAFQKLSKSLHRNFQVRVISTAEYSRLALRDGKTMANGALEILSPGDTRARPPAEREGFLRSAGRSLARLAR